MPVIAIPFIAAFYDVRFAVALMVIPNFVTNLWQIKNYRIHDLDNNLATTFAISGIVGAGIGTLLLAYLPMTLLELLIAFIVFMYIILKFRSPEFHLPMHTILKWAGPSGTCAGVLQGAIGLSAPIAITFLHAARLPRPTFIYVVSLFFAGMCIIQLPLQAILGLMTWEIATLSIIALIPIAIGLPIGEWIGKKLSPVVFDRLILALLTVLACKMLFDAVFSP